MKWFAVLASALLLFACGSPQPETDPAINIPGDAIQAIATPDLTSGINLAEQNACRANMQTASASITMVQAQTGAVPATLGEALNVPICPDGGSYIYTVEGDSWRLECPSHPSHGFIESGRASW